MKYIPIVLFSILSAVATAHDAKQSQELDKNIEVPLKGKGPAEIIEHNDASDLADLPEHPIPALNGLDIMSVKTAGGADLIIVIADPMDGSEFSQNRLLVKLQNYFGFINSEEYVSQTGVIPTPRNTKIIVKLHPGSSAVYSDLIARSQAWAHENNSSVELEYLTESELEASN